MVCRAVFAGTEGLRVGGQEASEAALHPRREDGALCFLCCPFGTGKDQFPLLDSRDAFKRLKGRWPHKQWWFQPCRHLPSLHPGWLVLRFTAVPIQEPGGLLRVLQQNEEGLASAVGDA